MSDTNKTKSLTVTFTLDSSAAQPPYNVTGCSGTITYTQDPDGTFTGWGTETMAEPQSGGADFTLNVTDSNCSASNQTSIGNWALTFIPRSPTTERSPFGGGTDLVTGTGPSSPTNGSTFTLDTKNNKIKQTGTWDWALMVQVILPNNGGTKCFGSDPEMDVES